MAVQLEQRIDVRKIAPTRWRVVVYLGKSICFYGETGSETPDFTASNEFGQGDIGSWRAVDRTRHLVVGYGGKAIVKPKAEGKPGEVTVNFDGIVLAL
jgi:hypothetical protein